MTDFAQTLRHFCRNPRCRMKLKAPVENAHDAFCTRGCYLSFHRKRCVVCEQPMERNTEQQLICGKRQCRNALEARQNLGRYLASSNGVSSLENPIKPGIKTGHEGDRPWRIAAGQELTPSQFHCAVVADGPDCQWKGGEYQRLEARNQAALKAAGLELPILGGEFTEPEWREVISPDGVSCFVTQSRNAQTNGAPSDWRPSRQSHWQSSDDDIPHILKR